MRGGCEVRVMIVEYRNAFNKLDHDPFILHSLSRVIRSLSRVRLGLLLFADIQKERNERHHHLLRAHVCAQKSALF